MTVEDIKSKKMKLEEMIENLITQFEEDTKTTIKAIQVSRNMQLLLINYDGTYHSTNIEVEVTI